MKKLDLLQPKEGSPPETGEGRRGDLAHRRGAGHGVRTGIHSPRGVYGTGEGRACPDGKEFVADARLCVRVREAARLLDRSRASVYRLIAAGRLETTCEPEMYVTMRSLVRFVEGGGR